MHMPVQPAHCHISIEKNREARSWQFIAIVRMSISILWYLSPNNYSGSKNQRLSLHHQEYRQPLQFMSKYRSQCSGGASMQKHSAVSLLHSQKRPFRSNFCQQISRFPILYMDLPSGQWRGTYGSGIGATYVMIASIKVNRWDLEPKWGKHWARNCGDIMGASLRERMVNCLFRRASTDSSWRQSTGHTCHCKCSKSNLCLVSTARRTARSHTSKKSRITSETTGEPTSSFNKWTENLRLQARIKWLNWHVYHRALHSIHQPCQPVWMSRLPKIWDLLLHTEHLFPLSSCAW